MLESGSSRIVLLRDRSFAQRRKGAKKTANAAADFFASLRLCANCFPAICAVIVYSLPHRPTRLPESRSRCRRLVRLRLKQSCRRQHVPGLFETHTRAFWAWRSASKTSAPPALTARTRRSRRALRASFDPSSTQPESPTPSNSQNLAPPTCRHVSWLADDRGFLMFADLIPQDIETLSAEFKLPTGWTVESSFVRDVERSLRRSPNLRKPCFFVGRSLRKTSNTIDGVDLDVVLSGAWPFKEAEALKVASTVMQKYLAADRIQTAGQDRDHDCAIPDQSSAVQAGKLKREAPPSSCSSIPKKFDFWRNQLDDYLLA